jgi:hypothetical protein
MKRAFDLADKSAFDYYRDLSEKDIITGSSPGNSAANRSGQCGL